MLRLFSKTVCSDPSVFDEGLPCGALVEPFSVGSRPANEFAALRNDIPRCVHCSAVQNRLCFVEASGGGEKWVCSFCYGSNDNPSVNFESLGPVMDYEAQSSPFFEPHLMTGPHRGGMIGNRGACVWVVDGMLPSTSLLTLSRNFEALCADFSLPVRSWGLVIFTGVVSVYRLARGGAALAEVLPGDCFPDESIVNKTFGDSVGSFFMEGCGPNVNTESPLAHVLSMLAARRRDSPGCGGSRGRWKQKGRNKVKRCLGAAVKCALELMRISGQGGGRLIVCLSGAPNTGPGATIRCAPGALVEDIGENMLADTQDTYHGLSQAAVLQETCIDVLCADYGHLGAQSLETLVRGCGGYVLPLHNFGDQFRRTADILLSTQRTVASVVHLELRVSLGWLLGNVVGPVRLADSTMEGSGSSSASKKRASSTSVVTHHLTMGKVDPLVGIAVYIKRESKEIDPPPSCTVQVVARWTGENGNLLTRILTSSASVSHFSNFVSGLDVDIVSALLAKRVILSSLNRRNGETEQQTLAFGRSMVDNAVRNVYEAAREYGSDKTVRVLPLNIPYQLRRIQQRLFHLWRGPLLGHMVSNADERYLYAELLLKGCLKATLGLIGPSLHVMDPVDTQNSTRLLQSETLCLLPDRILLVDTWDVLYIWVGSEVDASSEAKSARISCMKLAEDMCKKDTRLPAALIQVVEAGESWSRFVTTRLEPSHKDAPQPGEHSKISHIRRLLCKEMNTDDLSFNAYIMKTCR